MITPELKSYVEGELGKGTAKETIRDNLLKNGWAVEDVEQVFAATAISFVPPAPKPEPGLLIRPAVSKPDTKPDARPKGTHKKTIAVIAVAALVLLGGVGAYAYYSGMFLSLPRLAAQAIDGARAANSARYDVTVNVSVPANALSAIEAFAGGLDYGQVSMTLKGGYDITEPENIKSSAQISLAMGGVAVAGEIRVVGDMLYAVLTEAPDVGFLPMFSSYENKWVSLPYKSESGQFVENPVTGLSPVSAGIASDLTEAQKAEISAMLRDARIIKVTKRFPPESMGGEPSYHFAFDLDRDGIRSFLQELEGYINTVGKEDSAMSAFDLSAASEGLENIQDFQGEIWVGRSDKLPRKISARFSLVTPEMPEEKTNVNLVSIWSGWNEPVAVAAPTETISLEELMAASFGMAVQASGDANIKATLLMLRAEAELFFDSKTPGAYTGFCASQNSKDAQRAIEAEGGKEFVCKESKTAWAAAAKLPDSLGYWCVDSIDSPNSIKTKLAGTVCK